MEFKENDINYTLNYTVNILRLISVLRRANDTYSLKVIHDFSDPKQERLSDEFKEVTKSFSPHHLKIFENPVETFAGKHNSYDIYKDPSSNSYVARNKNKTKARGTSQEEVKSKLSHHEWRYEKIWLEAELRQVNDALNFAQLDGRELPKVLLSNKYLNVPKAKLTQIKNDLINQINALNRRKPN